MRTSISILFVVHDRSDRIESIIARWAIRGDELVLVDNNSSDDTLAGALEVAKRYRNVIVLGIRSARSDSVWHLGAITAARNAGLALVNSDWALVIDDDEDLSDQGLYALRNLAKNADHLGFFLPWNTYDSDGRLRIEDYKLSFFRARREVCYEGLIHENPTSSIRKACGTCGLASVELQHFPTTRATQRKQTAYLSALRSAIVLVPECARTRWFLGLTCYKLGMVEEARKHLMASARMEKDVIHPIERINASFFLAWLEWLVGEHEEGRQWLDESFRLYSIFSGDLEMVAHGKVLGAMQRLLKVASGDQAIDANDATRFFYCF